MRKEGDLKKGMEFVGKKQKPGGRVKIAAAVKANRGERGWLASTSFTILQKQHPSLISFHDVRRRL